MEGGLVVADGVSGDGVVVVGANNPLPVVFEKTNHYDYDHTGFTYFAPPRECFVCIYQDCKAKYGVINAISVLPTSV